MKKNSTDNGRGDAVKDPTYSIVVTDTLPWREPYQKWKSFIDDQSGINSIEIVISNGSFYALLQKVAAFLEGIRVERIRTMSEMFAKTRGRYLIVMNGYCQPAGDFIAEVIKSIAQKNVGLIEPKTRFADDKLLEAGGMIFQNGSRKSCGQFDDVNKRKYCYTKEIDCALPYAYIIDRTAFEKAGSPNQALNDALALADLSFKMRGIGYQTIFNPKINLTDPRTSSAFSLDLSSSLEGKAEFAKRWQSVLAQENALDSTEEFVCCNRSKQKKCLLYIDWQIPEYDTNAGDRMTFQTLKLLCTMNMNIKFVGTNAVLNKRYAEELEEMGIELVGFDGDGADGVVNYIKKYGMHIDYAYVNRPGIAAKYLPLISERSNAKIVYNMVDLHFLRMERELNFNSSKVTPKAIDSMRTRETSILKSADISLTPSTFEQHYVSGMLPDIEVRVSPIFIFDDFPKLNDDFTTRSGLLFVGGFGHRPNVDAMEWFCKEIFPSVLEKIPDIKLHIAGAYIPNSIKEFANQNIIIAGHLSDSKLHKLYNSCRLVIVPLRYGAGVKGKVVEAMYYGTPVVSTSIGAEGLAGIDRCIESVDDELAFARKIVDLYRDTARLLEIAKRSQQYVREHFSTEVARRFYEEIFL
jgi:glycosyltransferase involved in cell wall biosynthesis